MIIGMDVMFISIRIDMIIIGISKVIISSGVMVDYNLVMLMVLRLFLI